MLTPDLRQMYNDMTDRGVTEAAMESTAVYWVSVWNELCESMELKLVNPYFIKQLPGRKSDVKDAQWIAECLLKNLIKGSFVPEPIVQDMRKLNRRIFDLQEDVTYYSNKLDAALHRCGFRLRKRFRHKSIVYRNSVWITFITSYRKHTVFTVQQYSLRFLSGSYCLNRRIFRTIMPIL